MIIADIIIKHTCSQTDVFIDNLANYIDFPADNLQPTIMRLKTRASIIPRIGLFDASVTAVSLPLKSHCGKIKNNITIPIGSMRELHVLDDMHLSELDSLKLSELDSYVNGSRLMSLPIELTTHLNINELNALDVSLSASSEVFALPSLRHYDNDLLTRLDPYTLNELDLGI